MGGWFEIKLGKSNSYNYLYRLLKGLADKEFDYDFRLMWDREDLRWVAEKRLSSNPQVMLWEYAR